MSDHSSQTEFQTALFVCFGGMSNVGILTGLAGLEVMKRVGREKVCIFCLGGLPTRSPGVLDKTTKASRIITVDGCQLNCARKIVEEAGFLPTASLTLVTDCGIAKKPSLDYTPEDLGKTGGLLLEVVNRAGSEEWGDLA